MTDRVQALKFVINLCCYRWAIWVAAISGSLYNFMFLEKYKLFEVLIYLFVGVFPGLLLYFFNQNIDETAE